MAGTDLISRQDAIDALRAAYWDKNIQSAKDDPCIVDAMTDWAIRQIKALPSAERKGKWININPDDDDPEQFGIYVWKCSVCGELFCCKGNYCMHCGARMEGE